MKSKTYSDSAFFGMMPTTPDLPKPIRVAHVMGKMVGGGVESAVMNFYRHIDRDSIQFDFIIDEDSSDVPVEEIEKLGGRIFYVRPHEHVLDYMKDLRALFEKKQWKIVHSHLNTLSVFPLKAAKDAGIPIRIAHSHSTSNKGEFSRNAIKSVLKRFSNVYATEKIACSSHAGRWLFGREGDYWVLHNAIDMDRFRFDADVRKKKREELGVNDSILVIGHVGRFVTQKNHALLLDMFAALHDMNGDAILVLIGDGPLKEQVKSKVRELGLADSVLFLGQRADVEDWYQAFDVFALPSLYEGLGIVAIEAQASGLPVILSDGVPEEAKLTENVRFVPLQASPQEWAAVALDQYERSVALRFDEVVLGESYDLNSETAKLCSFYKDVLRHA